MVQSLGPSPIRQGLGSTALALSGLMSMGFTFVTDCPASLRLLSTPARADAVAVPSRLNDLIGRMRLSLMTGLVFGIARRSRAVEVERLDPKPLGMKSFNQASWGQLAPPQSSEGTTDTIFNCTAPA